MRLKRANNQSVYHSIYNCFADKGDHLLGTQDFVEYCDYKESEIILALDELVVNDGLCREKVGGVFVYYLFPQVGSVKPNSYHRDLAENLGR